MVAGGGRSKEGDDGGASGRAPLVSDRWDEEEGGDDNQGPQPDKYLAVTWADHPPLQSGPFEVSWVLQQVWAVDVA